MLVSLYRKQNVLIMKKSKASLPGSHSSSALNEEQRKVFASFVSGANLYITGKGGSGKSFLTRHIIDYCHQKGRKALICAPTGIAALNIGGATIHRTFGAPASIIEPGERCRKKNLLEIIDAAEVIIIDEISMCRVDLFEYVANTLLHMKNRKQLVLVGDFYQLPPVLTPKDTKAFSVFYDNRLYAFESNLWQKLQLQTMELQSSMRQKDKVFVKTLDNIREGIPDFSVFKNSSPDPMALTICGTNDEADKINKENLKWLKKHGAKISKIEAKGTGTVESSEKPTDEILALCPGARVVMLNNDKDNTWVNGSFGTIIGIKDNELKIRIEDNGSEISVERYKWTYLEYDVESTEDGKKKLVTKERGLFEQFPVRLAWAITIHKSQGQTYEHVNVSAENIFAEGQLYVALSRCKTIEGMHISGKLTDSKVIASEAVKHFMKSGNYQPRLTGQMLPFTEEEPPTPSDQSYQNGYDDGYKDGTEDTEAKYKEKIASDPGVKILSDYTRRQKELAMIEDPEIRNPKGAGRKPKEPGKKQESKAIRVPLSIFEAVKTLSDLVKEDASYAERFEKFIESCTQI